MNRDLNKYIAEYEHLFRKSKGNRGAFYASDINQIVEISKNDSVVATFKALRAGFMIGYRAAKAETRRKNNAYTN